MSEPEAEPEAEPVGESQEAGEKGTNGLEAAEKKEKDAPEISPPSMSVGEKKVSDHSAQCRDMFEKITEYLNGELAGASWDLCRAVLT